MNVLANLERLGARTLMVSALGADELGGAARRAVRQLGIDDAYVATLPDVQTGVVDVRLDAAGGPTYIIRSPAAYERASLTSDEVLAIVGEEPRALVFGTLALRFEGPRRAVADIVAAAPHVLRVYDVNLRPDAWQPSLLEELLTTADVVKLNGDELTEISMALSLPRNSTASFARALIDRYSVSIVCVTHGDSGAEAFTAGDAVSVGGHRVVVADTIGAGDAFTAGLTHALLSGLPLSTAVEHANALGAVVTRYPGATPAWTPGDLRELLGRSA